MKQLFCEKTPMDKNEPVVPLALFRLCQKPPPKGLFDAMSFVFSAKNCLSQLQHRFTAGL